MHVNAGDTAWMLTATALVFFMMPGLALFYGGLVGEKNVLSTMAQSFVAIGVVSILWIVVGYSVAFGPDHSWFIGGFQYFMLRGIGTTPSPFAPDIPPLLFMAFQMMFAVITPALIAGAFIGRMRFRGYLVFIGLWSLVVYSPFAHWVWGGGFLGASGLHAVDFAGGSVVHELAGASALATVLYVGRRRQFDRPHNVPLVLLGAGILWFGWFGFNAGSADGANAVAVAALVNTQIGACAGMLAWMFIEWTLRRKPSGVGIASGAVAGLAAITPAAGYVPTWAALVIGAAAGLLCYLAVRLKDRLRYDDALDVVGVHMVGGFIGVVLTGVFASLAVNAVSGGIVQFGRQVVLAFVGLVFPFVMTWIILWITDTTVGLRVSDHDQDAGLDASDHAEVAYDRP
ncbi:MAG TPA: ammonium transporter [Acidimicrobiales bacterium]|jgi:ammonium transporter, Amt family|nr:ammonium transporter [Acidimicrobiales bacterium]